MSSSFFNTLPPREGVANASIDDDGESVTVLDTYILLITRLLESVPNDKKIWYMSKILKIFRNVTVEPTTCL